MYFNAQRARIPGPRTTSHGWVSTYPLSQKAGRVTMAGSQLIRCLKKRVGSKSQVCSLQTVSVKGFRPSLPKAGGQVTTGADVYAFYC